MEELRRTDDSPSGDSVELTEVDITTTEALGETSETESDVSTGEGNSTEQYDVDFINDQRYILEPSRLRILQAILATEWGSLSPKEIAYRISDIEETTVRDHLTDMADRENPIISKLTVESGKRKQNFPYTYYAVTEYGIRLLKSVSMYDNITILYQMFSRMERPEEIEDIEEFENRPTPNWL